MHGNTPYGKEESAWAQQCIQCIRWPKIGLASVGARFVILSYCGPHIGARFAMTIVGHCHVRAGGKDRRQHAGVAARRRRRG